MVQSWHCWHCDIVQHFGWKRFEMNWDDCLAQGQQSFSLRVLWLGALLAPCLGAMWNWTQIKLPFQVICLSNLIFCEGSERWTWPCHKLKWSQLMSRDQMHEKNHAHNVDQKRKWEVNIESGNWNYYWKVSVRKTKDCCETACKMPHERGQIWKM